MEYLKKLTKSLLPILIIYIIQYIILIIISSVYLFLGYKNLNRFVSSYGSVITIITSIIIIYILIKKYKYKNKSLNKKLYFPFITIGISISCLLNMIIFIFNPSTNQELIPIYLSVLSSGIIGPILEELLFRYILLNKLKEFNDDKKSIILATIIFSIVHVTPIKIIYALILGLILNIVYHKTNNLKSSIIIHMSANTISIFLSKFNIIILFLSIVNLIISTLIIKKQYH